MDIVGVAPLNCRLEHVYSCLTKMYPDGIESMVIEIEANREETDPYKYPSFFEKLSDRFQERGTRVINGDIPLPLPTGLRRAVDYCNGEDSTLIGRVVSNGICLYYSLADFAINGIYDCYIGHNRDKNFERVVREVNPQVVLVGKIHARRLSRKFKDATYVGIPI